jgi:hypothetical protein
MLERFKKCLSLKSQYKHVDNDGSYLTIKDGNKLHIYFEWSNGKVDWINNFRFLAIPKKPYKDMSEGIWFCHRGFFNVFKSIEPHIIDDILDPEIDTIDIVGYSHGGALAQLCYEYVKFHRPDVAVTGYGFGAPRVFWGIASKAVKTRFEGFKVVRNGKDIVTHLPPKIFGYRHICDVIEIGTVATSKGLINDHREENYIESLEEYYCFDALSAESGNKICSRCGKIEFGIMPDWEIHDGKLLCPDCAKEYAGHMKDFMRGA